VRVFCAVRHSIDPGRYYGGLWSANFYPALRQLGHEVVESQTDLLAASRFMHIAADFTPEEKEVRAKITESIMSELRNEHARRPVDLFLSYFYNAHFDPAGVDEIRRLGIPSINFYCNSIYQFENVAAIAAAVDFSWHAERDARDSYLSVGAKPIWVQMGADPDVYRPVENVKREPVAVFVGQRYADRDRMAATLIQANVPLALYGPGWSGDQSGNGAGKAEQTKVDLGRRAHVAGSRAAYWEAVRQNWASSGFFRGTQRTLRQIQYRNESRRLMPLFRAAARGAVKFEDQRQIFSSYELVLNFSNVWADGRPGSKLIPHVRLRDFEAPMCRSCYLTGHTDEIVEFYQLGNEIDTYASHEELVDKSRFYLANWKAAEKLRNAGFERARRDHTWARRFEELFQKIGVSHGR
jgi:hypothetical protein